MMCHCSREQFMFEESMSSPEAANASMDAAASGLSAKTMEGEAKLDEGNIEEAESSLREALSLNFEEARALLGRLEYQRGNVEAALQVFDGIDITTIVPRMRHSLAERGRHRRGRSRTESGQSISLHAASLLLEAIYLKAKSLQKLGRLNDAAQECRSILDTIDSALPQGIPESWSGSKLQDIVSKAVELLPELYKEAGLYQEAISAYRRALLNPWNLDSECSGRIQKSFAVLLLYGGVEAGAPSLAAQVEGAFTPKNNVEEAILLFQILLRKNTLRKLPWDYTIMEHLSFALSICGQSYALAQQFEEVLPGTYGRSDRWYNLALCYSAAGQGKTAVNVLKKSLSHLERPNDVPSLLLAAKLCVESPDLTRDGVEYGRRAILFSEGKLGYLKGRSRHLLGAALGKEARNAKSDAERCALEDDALRTLQDAVAIEKKDPYAILDFGMESAEKGDLSTALDCAKSFLELTGGSSIIAWRFLALVLSAQQRHVDAEVVINAALEETAKWEQAELLRTKGKLQLAQMQTSEAIKTFMLLLALVQAQRKTTGSSSKNGGDSVSEVEVWQDLAGVYTSLSQWRDAEMCLEKAQAFKKSPAATWFQTGYLYECRGQEEQAMASYNNALCVDPDHVPSQVALGGALKRSGSKAFPVARSYLTAALRLEPKNYLAWFNLGLVHEEEVRLKDAAACFQAAYLLEQSAPVEKFSTLR
ncbi:protein NPG1 [Selaginella moellendorffii]|nr:protein NPG1 [Selaginella moellendorffii]XP_024530062.1 protein NPG1 [Selaginella moellendorffii]|eukprot:XP_002969261.2 protein NPG1 [Selaginella moellendorffii]